MASPRPLALPNRLAGTLLEDLGEALADHSLPSGLLRSADALSSELDTHPGPRLPTGAPAFDPLLSGGLALGSFAELAGPLSSGLTACAQALAAAASQRARAAWVDLADAFDPPSAVESGVALERVLWVRAPTPQVALRASERLLLSRVFSLVVLDFIAPTGRPSGRERPRRGAGAARSEARRRSPSPPGSAWRRLQRSAAQAPCTLLLLSSAPLAGAVPSLTVRARGAEPCFDGASASDPAPFDHTSSSRSPRASASESWLEGAIAHFDLVRDRRRPREQSVSLPLAAHPEVPPRACRVSPGSRSPRRRSAAHAS